MTNETFTKIIALIEEAFATGFTEQRQQVWWQLLADLGDEEAMRATVLLCRESKYPPKPADIWTRCRPPQSGDERAARATYAWLYVREAIDDPYRSILFEDRAIPLAIAALGGIMELSQKTSEELDTFVRKEFERIYTAFKATGHEHSNGYIPGIVETMNRSNGHLDSIVDIKRIGGSADGAIVKMLVRDTEDYVKLEDIDKNGLPPAQISPLSGPNG